MSTQFFERQEVQRKATRWLVLAFIAAIVAVVLVINCVVIVGLGENPLRMLRTSPEFIFWLSVIVGAAILGATWYKSFQLRAGGAVVARSLGGIAIGTGEQDFARKRLLNIVEEMALAARIKKPMVFVLPDEQGINAFAAGHSPDEAAVAVTQGALDKLDREQLQAVIGHEFSHILNGDMQINMRLAAWIFGLFVITDLASRLMRGRSRGKDAARLKMIALGIFIAGSVGMIAGRLLQAAVSRRREHLADASAVQFTRNPGALQGAFIAMAALQDGSRIQHPGSADVAHMFFANGAPAWANKVGGSWFATHPPLEERVHALDRRVTPSRFRSLVTDERRKIASRAAAAEAAEAAAAQASAAAAPGIAAATDAASSAVAALPTPAVMPSQMQVLALDTPAVAASGSRPAPQATLAEDPMDDDSMALAETMPTGVRMVGGRALPPDTLRNRLPTDLQAAIGAFVADVEGNPLAVQGVLVASMLASEPAKWRSQIIKLAQVLGIELFKETQTRIARIARLAPPGRLPLVVDLLPLLDTLDPAHRKRLRAVARAFAPTVVTGDMRRYAVTRILERRLAKAVTEPLPVPLPERAEQVCQLYIALAQCRFGAGKQGQNSYRAGVMGMLPPQKWLPYPEALITPAELDAILEGLRAIHPTGKKGFSEGLARVIAVGGRLTAAQVDLLRAACLLIDCPVPLLPVDVVFEENELVAAAQANAR